MGIAKTVNALSGASVIKYPSFDFIIFLLSVDVIFLRELISQHQAPLLSIKGIPSKQITFSHMSQSLRLLQCMHVFFEPAKAVYTIQTSLYPDILHPSTYLVCNPDRSLPALRTHLHNKSIAVIYFSPCMSVNSKK